MKGCARCRCLPGRPRPSSVVLTLGFAGARPDLASSGPTVGHEWMLAVETRGALGEDRMTATAVPHHQDRRHHHSYPASSHLACRASASPRQRVLASGGRVLPASPSRVAARPTVERLRGSLSRQTRRKPHSKAAAFPSAGAPCCPNPTVTRASARTSQGVPLPLAARSAPPVRSRRPGGRSQLP